MSTTAIINEILKDLPKNIITSVEFEGANIVIYTKDGDFFLNEQQKIKNIVDKIKKRVELRPDPSISKPQAEAEEIIRKALPKDAAADKIIFEPHINS